MFVNSRRNRRPFNLWPMKTASRERMKERKWIIYQCDAITIANAMILLLLLLLSLLMLLFWFLLLLRLKCDKHRLSGTPTHIYIVSYCTYMLHLNETVYVRCNFFGFLLSLGLATFALCSVDKRSRTNQISITKLIVEQTTKFPWIHVCVTFSSSYFPITAKQIVVQRNACVHSLTRTHMFNVWIFLLRSSSEIKYTFINRIGYYVLLFCVAKWHRHRKRVE